MLGRTLLLLLTVSWAVGAEPAGPPSPRLPEILYCSLDYNRRALIDVAVDPAAVSVRTTPDKQFTATVRVLSPTQVEIRLQALKAGHGMLELVGPEGVLHRCRLQEVNVDTNASKSIGAVDHLPDGSTVFAGELILRPYAPGLDIRFICLSTEVTATDGLGERWMRSDSFTPTPSTGNGITSFRMVQAPNAKWVPYTYVIYQDGEQVSAP
jgi:hypothetical protein